MIHPLTRLAREIEEKSRGEILVIGKEYKWDNKTVRIVDGQYMGMDGVSNFWYWREVLPNRDLGRRLYCSYASPKGDVMHTPGHKWTESRKNQDREWHDDVPWYGWGNEKGQTGPSETDALIRESRK